MKNLSLCSNLASTFEIRHFWIWSSSIATQP